LQLNADVQVVRHSAFGTTQKAIEHVLSSFAARAPGDTLLAVKNHPFDTGLSRFGEFFYRRARDLGVEKRICYFETGDANALIDHSQGVITVNSTVGMSALQRGRPTKALGRAVYDLPGLTHQAPLDDFWQTPRPPDAALCRAFRNVVVHATQINGGFYTGEAIALALREWRRLLEPQSRLESLLAAHPPAEADAGERMLAAQAA
jgi:capsular polysaccharide export protein